MVSVFGCETRVNVLIKIVVFWPEIYNLFGSMFFRVRERGLGRPWVTLRCRPDPFFRGVLVACSVDFEGFLRLGG